MLHFKLRISLSVAFLAFSSPVYSQSSSPPALQPQTDNWNSTFTLTSAQISAANISTANDINIALQFERTNWATGSVHSDPFYTSLPSNASSAAPGSLLKLEAFVNTTTYTLAPTLALSRIVYQSATLNNTAVPASAYILWPYHPRTHGPSNKIPLVAFGHGSSGIFSECAPSHIRNLWYAYSAPFTLALQGYAVVAPDFAGLGVASDTDGNEIVHQALANPAAANDLVFAVQAAQTAFAELSGKFVVVGHSAGGGAAWAVAQRQVSSPVHGYLGAVVGSPTTNVTRQVEVQMAQIGFITIARSIVSSFKNGPTLGDILTAQGRRLLKLLGQVSGCNSVLVNLLLGLVVEGDPSKLAWFNESFWGSYWHESWQNTTVAGGKEVAGPMLVLQGEADTTVPESVTTEAVNKTCQAFPRSDIEYIRAAGVDHVPMMYATQTIWLEWIADRFAGRSSTTGQCQYRSLPAASAPRPLEDYSAEINYFLEFATAPYQVA
jgi:alpha-beta hydrolase superfamily lysophospholipase